MYYREERKNVHAFARGMLQNPENFSHCICNDAVTYNPYECGSFTYKDTGEPIHSTEHAYICSNTGIFIE